MRISDWSSDVCSSDLFLALAVHRRRLFGRRLDAGDRLEQDDVEIGAIFVEEELDRWEAARSRDRVGLVDTADELFLLPRRERSEAHTSELQSLMRHSYAVSCLQTNTKHTSQIQ